MDDGAGTEAAAPSPGVRIPLSPPRVPREIRTLQQLLRVEETAQLLAEEEAKQQAILLQEQLDGAGSLAERPATSPGPPTTPSRTGGLASSSSVASLRGSGLSLSPPRSPLIKSQIVKPPRHMPAFLTHSCTLGGCAKCRLLEARALEPLPSHSPEALLEEVRGPFDVKVLLPRRAPLRKVSSLPALSSETYRCWQARQAAAEQHAALVAEGFERGRKQATEVARQLGAGDGGAITRLRLRAAPAADL